jgi:hypothetical protein
MGRIAASLIAFALAAACQPSPSPSRLEAGSIPPSAVPTGSAPTSPPSTATTTSFDVAGPFVADAYEYTVIENAVDTFATGLVDQYDGATAPGLARIFTQEGLAAAMSFDWRLRGAVREETWFRGDVRLRGFSTTREEGLARPPVLETNVGFVVDPGAELVDIKTGAVVQHWSERQYFAMLVALLYDATTAEWRAAAVSPAVDWHQPDSRLPDPVRCPGLGPDLPDRADPKKGRTWCFGGADGTWAVPDQFNLLTRVPCGETRASVVSVGWPIGSAMDRWDIHDYVRDPLGEFEERWPLPQRYLADTKLPADAYTTGLTDGEFEVFISPEAGPSGIWVRHGDRFERWPRAGPWGVIDCN